MLGVTVSQPDMQSHLESIYQHQGLSATLCELYTWSLAVGYIKESQITGNPSYDYWDELLKISFKIQINLARTQYTPHPSHLTKDLHCAICFNQVLSKDDLRVFEMDFPNDREFFFQLTPFPLYPEHFVVIDKQHAPMRMDEQSVEDMLFLVDRSPDLVLCSNSDVEWAGSSILQHHHYQAIKSLHLPIMEAKLLHQYSGEFSIGGKSISYGLLDYPVFACKLESSSSYAVLNLGGKIIRQWKKKQPLENTCNLILRHTEGHYELHIIFRNPRYRTPLDLRIYKSEGVGVLEMGGMGILPVPSGANAVGIWQQIQFSGIDILKNIMNANTPVHREQYAAHFADIHELTKNNTLGFGFSETSQTPQNSTPTSQPLP